jgi:hypothetical protein
MKLSQAQKFAFVKRAHEKEGGELSPLERARKSVGTCRTHASMLNNGIDALKSKRLVSRLNNAFEKVVATPGNAAQRAMHAEVQKILESRSTEAIECLDRYVVPVAYYHLACVALDPQKPVAERLTKGNTAQRAIFDWCYELRGERAKRVRAGLEATMTEPDEALCERGRAIIDVMIELLGRHREAPDNLFDQTASPSAKASGYRMFRTRLLNDQFGWYGRALDKDDHQGRAELYTKGYRSGLQADLMWLHAIVPDIAHPNNAWNLAIHAGDWAESVRFAAALLKDYPNLLYEPVMGLPPVYQDKPVWPGVAAIVADSRFYELDQTRAQLNHARYSEMMMSVRKMVPGIINKNSYVEVLTLEKSP